MGAANRNLRRKAAYLMSNQIPQSYDLLVQLLEDAADGAHQHAAATGLKQNTEAAIRADLEALVGTPAGPGNVPPAVPGFKALWNTAKTASGLLAELGQLLG